MTGCSRSWNPLDGEDAFLHALGSRGGACDGSPYAAAGGDDAAEAAGWPSFGQFVAHDITADRSGLAHYADTTTLRNARSPQINLECLYGDGEGLDNVQRAEAFGYTLFFVGDDHRLPFVTIADSDQDFDNISNLNRAGVFRINIGISKATFESLLRDRGPADTDHRVLDRFLPHPHYSKQNWVCILNPSLQNAETVKKLIAEAHVIAAARIGRQTDR